MANQKLPHYNAGDALQTADIFTNAVVLAANVPQIFNVPTDLEQRNAREVVFSCSRATAADFYAKPLLGTDANELTQTADNNWTANAGWAVAAGTATATTSSNTLTETSGTPGLVNGQKYLVTFTMTRSAGSVAVSLGGGSAGTSRSAGGTYSEIITAGSAQDITFTGTGFSGTITLSSISVIKTVAVPAAAITDGSSPDLNPPGYNLNRQCTKIMVVSAGTPTITASFFK